MNNVFSSTSVTVQFLTSKFVTDFLLAGFSFVCLNSPCNGMFFQLPVHAIHLCPGPFKFSVFSSLVAKLSAALCLSFPAQFAPDLLLLPNVPGSVSL